MGNSTTKRIALNYLSLSAGELVSRLINFASLIYLARVLGTYSFGLFGFTQAILTYLLLVVDSGLSIFGTKEIAKNKQKASALVINLLLLRLLIALVLFIVSAVVVMAVPLTAMTRLIFFAAFVFLFARALNIDWAFQGIEKMHYVGLARIVQAIIMFAFFLILVRGAGDIFWAQLAIFIGGLAAAVFLLLLAWSWLQPITRKTIALENWSSYFGEAMPLGASLIISQVYCNMDIILLGIMKDQQAVGFYNAATKLFFGALVFLELWQVVIMPIATRRLQTDRWRAAAFLTKSLRLTLICCVPLAFIVTVLSPAIIKLFFGASYLPAAGALQILIWSMLAIAVSRVYGMLILVPLGKTKQYLSAVLVGALFNLAANLVFIPFYGFLAAAVVTVLSEILVLIVLGYFAQKELPLNYVGPLSKTLLVTCLTTALLYGGWAIFPTLFNLPLILALDFAVVYFVFLLLFGEGPFILSFVRGLTQELIGANGK